MDVSTLVNTISNRIPGINIRAQEPMRDHCSFRIGGAADIFVQPASEAELTELMAMLHEMAVPALIIGNGTNLLVSDGGFRGAVIKLGGDFSSVRCCGNTISCGAAVTLARLAAAAQQNALAGLEFAHGIPGSLGGAIVMNAGAYGGEMRDVTASVRALGEDGVIRTYSADELDLTYRHSRFSDGGEVVLSAELALHPGDREAIAEQMRTLMARRSASQPLDMPSAGSTFKRPACGYAAAMIDGAGLKGFAVGGAQVSEKHAGFVVNTGGATFDDVIAVMDHVRETVLGKYGVELENEVKIVH